MSAEVLTKMSPTIQQQQQQQQPQSKVHLTPRKDADGFNGNGRSYFDSPSPSKDPLDINSPKSLGHPHWQMDKYDEFEFEVPEEAPVFVPTAEEFKNPLIYIQKIRPLAEKYGVCKIKPPEDWQPPFVLDVDKLRFTPRVQRINELEAKTRIKLNFLDQIAKFWELQGSSLKIPMVERKQLDLYTLHRCVQEEGGLEIVTKERKWSKIAGRLKYPNGKNVGTILKGHYERILYPYDIYMGGKHVDGATLEAGEESDDCDYKPHCIISRQGVKPQPEVAARRSKRFQNIEPENGEMNLSKDKNAELRRLQMSMPSPTKQQHQMRSSPYKQRHSNNSAKSHTQTKSDPLAKYVCLNCNRGDVEEAMLLCDGCDDSYHTFCLIPPLNDVPKGDWRCPKCVCEEVKKPSEAFGFEQASREYSLKEFGEMADQFKSEYFNMPVHMVPTEVVEKEFWRITSSIEEDVTVEYAADLHTIEHGSGFPTRDSNNLSADDHAYVECGWNLNNFPVLEESVLAYINDDISGMVKPWLYAGMCFATFCWHNEDHWSYSVNYMHWGEPKTWYGVPGTAAELLESSMKKQAPELFASQPDLLHQLVTIMNPNSLMNEGVPVYRTDQHAGEFVITFPRAYHAGFNQGYNLAEAVNFCPADWVKMGRECVNHYSLLRRYCVFSHDEIICKMALEAERLNMGIATACYLDMVEMIDSEKRMRKSLLEWGVTKAQREAFELMQDDERICDVCKTTCFLSAVSCSCRSALACLRHYRELCKCPPEQHTLKYRYTLDELPLMLKKLKIKAESFETWLTKVRNILDPAISAKVSFEELQELAMEAQQKKFPKSPLLERLNSSVVEAEKCITVIQQLDINKIRTRNSNDIASRYKITLEELDLFVLELDNLCCTIDDFATVKELQSMGHEFVATVRRLLVCETVAGNDPKELQKVIQDGSTLCIELPQIEQLRARLEQVTWYRTIRAYRDKTERHQLSVLKKHLADGMKVPPHHTIERELSELKEMIVEMELWEDRAQKIFESSLSIQLRDVQDLLRLGKQIKGHLPSFTILKEAVDRARELLEHIDALQSDENYPYVDSLEFIINSARSLPFQLEPIQTMERHVNEANAWKEQANQMFLKRNTKYTLLEALTPKYESDLTFAVVPPSLSSPPIHRAGSDDCESASPSSTASSSSTISANSSNGTSEGSSYLDELGPAVVVATFKKAEKNEICRIVEIRRLNGEKHPERDAFCLCKGRFMGFMYHCRLCNDWFHSSCVPPMAKNYDAKHEPLELRSKYLCPICMRTKRPKLENILSLLLSLQQIPLRVPEGEIIQCVTERAMQWQARVRQALKRKDIEMALLELSMHQPQKPKLEQQQPERRGNNKRSKLKSKSGEHEQSSDCGSDDDNHDMQLDNLFGASEKVLSPSLAVAPPSVQLNKATIQFLEDLMMEGDLLEVTLDETIYLWRLLNSARNYGNELEIIRKKYNIPLEMPMRIYSEDSIRKRKLLSGDEKPTRKYTKTVKEEIKKEPLDLSDNDDIDGDDVMDIEEADGTLPKGKGGKLAAPVKKRIVKKKPAAAKKAAVAAVKSEKEPKEQKEKVKPKRKKKVQPPVASPVASAEGNTVQSPIPSPIANAAKSSALVEPSKTPQQQQQQQQPVPKKTPKVKEEKKVKPKAQKSPATGQRESKQKAPEKEESAKTASQNDTDSDSSPEESDAYETCGVLNCTRPSESVQDWILCDGGCEVWYHMVCVGLKIKEVKPDMEFICNNCKSSKDVNAQASHKQ